MRIALIGGGTIARLVLEHARRASLGRFEIVALMGRPGGAPRARELAREFSVNYVENVGALASEKPQAVIEAASLAEVIDLVKDWPQSDGHGNVQIEIRQMWTAEGHGFSVVREFCGHGIGKQFHEEPQVLHYGRPGTGYKLQPGMVFTVEPMINAGRPGIRCLADGWTIVTADHSLSAQWEHTVLVTDLGYEIMTQSVGTPAPPPEPTLAQAS